MLPLCAPKSKRHTSRNCAITKRRSSTDSANMWNSVSTEWVATRNDCPCSSNRWSWSTGQLCETLLYLFRVEISIKYYYYCSHEIAEVAGLLAMSFGEEGVDRYIIVYKRDHPPSEDEIAARREGLEWNEAKAQEYKDNVSNLWNRLPRKLYLFPVNHSQRAKELLIEQDRAIVTKIVEPSSNYKDKYVHLIGQEAALEAARKTESNKSYGFGKEIHNYWHGFVETTNAFSLLSTQREQKRPTFHRANAGRHSDQEATKAQPSTTPSAVDHIAGNHHYFHDCLDRRRRATTHRRSIGLNRFAAIR